MLRLCARSRTISRARTGTCAPMRSFFEGRPKNAPDITLIQALRGYVRRRAILLRGFMQNEREIGIPFVQKAMSYSISTMAGHGSFIFVAFAYLEDEFLPLRMYAVCGISLSMIFQFYREVPLMLPFKWNALFLAINATMIAILLDEI